MQQKYLLTIEGDKLTKDFSRDIAKEFQGECFIGVEIWSIRVEKYNSKTEKEVKQNDIQRNRSSNMEI